MRIDDRPTSLLTTRTYIQLVAGTLLAASTAFAQVGTGVFRVDDTTGLDNRICGSVAQPCKSIQQAVNLASGGDTVRVAAGTYTYDPALDNCPTIDETSVVCLLNKGLTVLGGFTTANWTTPNPQANLTVVDGENAHRGIHVQSLAQPTVPYRVEGFTVTRGLTVGASSGPEIDISAWGGGMSIVFAQVTVRDMVFDANRAEGGSTASDHGGAGSGGGLSVRGNGSIQSKATLERVTFKNNVATGGTGPVRGGLGLGGGLFANFADVTGNALTFTDNSALGGSSPGGGEDPGQQRADAQGGAAAFQQESTGLLTNVSASGNLAQGGDAGNKAGGGFGGSFFAELATLTLRDADVRSGNVRGGDGQEGGPANGGGVMALLSTITLDRVLLIDNLATGGAGPSIKGTAGGGGAYFNASPTTMVNSIVADNVVELGSGGGSVGGGGGGVLLTGGMQLNMSHCTLARNRLGSAPLGGIAMILVGSGTVANVSYTIIADHTLFDGFVVALHAQPGTTVNLNRGLWAGNDDDHNNGDPILAFGTFTGLGSMVSAGSAGFAAPGSPSFDYHLLPSSPAIDQATGSAQTVDVDGQARTDTPEIGADEVAAEMIFTDGFESGNLTRWSASLP